ncbi:STAS/SEC14 domain-containing protein [Cuspidothrix issatschenkoi LEGE 03284]|uniref:STAS/SEC14 domain-containing protein n=1 Tax=Cuspidothrix issatschenkoi TaxID=230752 RepID=UPI001881D31A|nr:STAS/SEC14 domain-containing protein [Cuspidothrix issatschenkoi]MBE9232600.1 STAS/SEC14 domain-containing protein [Cuspidothrix issatschenkoi LEGE 03284]
MPTVKIEAQISALDLLQAVQQLSQHELEQFVEQILQFKAQKIAPNLSAKESELLIKINQDLPLVLQQHYENLIDKRNEETLTESEYQQLLDLTEQVETYQVQRLEYLTQLAQIRQVSLTNLITQMGINPINND